MASRLDRYAPAVAFVVPWAFGMAHASVTADWQTDLAVARAFAGSPRGLEGLVSAALSNLVGWVPVGSPLLRAGSLSALGLGVCALLVYRLSRRLLSRALPAGPIDAAIALICAWIATLGPEFVPDGTAAGGAAVATSLALAAFERATAPLSRRAAYAAGGLWALAFCESRLTALAVLLALGVYAAATRPRPSREHCQAAAAGAALGLLPPLGLAAGVALSPGRSALEVFAGAGASLAAPSVGPLPAAANAWLHSVGPVFALVAVAGGVAALARRSSRPLGLALLGLLAAGAVWFAAPPTALDVSAGTRLLGLAALAIATSLGLGVSVQLLGRARLPLARAASALLVVYGLSLVFVAADDASARASERDGGLTERWTDEALLSLPPSSLLLVRSEPVYLRLLAAGTLEGRRPDVLVVRTAAIARSSVRLELVEREPALIPIVRDVLLTGRPSELALSGLADARPMYVEIDPAWDARLYPHLVPHAFFSEFAAHPLGRSDRVAGVEDASTHFDEVAEALRRAPGRDPATRRMLAASLSERAVLLEALGDRTAAARATEQLVALEPDHAIGRALLARFCQKQRTRLDVRALLASR